MKHPYFLSKLLILIALITGTCWNNIFAQELSNKDATESAKQVYKYISTRNSFETKRVFSGQNCNHGNEIVQGYPKFVDALFDQTGKYPAIIGVDYEYTRRFTPAQLAQTNQFLIKHWNQGGLVTINWAPFNPWTNNYCRDLTKVNMTELVTPGTTVYTKWHQELDRIAIGLQELKDSGVVVIWRPLQEMNGDWFWWGIAAHPGNSEPFKNLWIEMYNYLTHTKGLNNLIWQISMVEMSNGIGPDFYYPGDDYIDILGNSVYKTQYYNNLYESMLALGKPITACETGPDHCCMNGNWDNMTMINGIRNHSPHTMYFLNWHDWVDHYVAIVSNQNATELMHDPWVITREDVNWKEDTTNILPIVELVLPQDIEEIEKGSSLLIEAIASDTDGHIVKVQFFNGYEMIGEVLEPPYQFEYSDVPAGTLHINIRAIDDKNGISVSEIKKISSLVTDEEIDNLIKNHEFDLGLFLWSSWNANGIDITFSKDNDYNLSGRNSLKAEIINGGNQNWMSQFMQQIELKPHIEYEIAFKARASKQAKINTQLRHANSPYTVYWQRETILNETPKVFGPFLYRNNHDDKNAQFMTFLGAQSDLTIWIDSLVVRVKNDFTSLPNLSLNKNDIALSCFPNPFSNNSTIKLELPINSNIQLLVKDINGRVLQKLANEFKPAGTYEINFDSTNLTPGIYFLQLNTTGNTMVTKMQLMKL